jgi:hypothetical protein
MLRRRHLEPQQLHGNTAYRIVSHSPANDEPRCLTAAANAGNTVTEDGGVELAPRNPARQQQQLWLLVASSSDSAAAAAAGYAADTASGTATTEALTPRDHASSCAAAGLYHICAVSTLGRRYLTRLPGKGGQAGSLALCIKADEGANQVGVDTEACACSIHVSMCMHSLLARRPRWHPLLHCDPHTLHITSMCTKASRGEPKPQNMQQVPHMAHTWHTHGTHTWHTHGTHMAYTWHTHVCALTRIPLLLLLLPPTAVAPAAPRHQRPAQPRVPAQQPHLTAQQPCVSAQPRITVQPHLTAQQPRVSAQPRVTVQPGHAAQRRQRQQQQPLHVYTHL